MRKTLLLLVSLIVISFVHADTDAYTVGKIASNGNIKKWDLSKTTRPNIDADGNIIIEFNSAGCADYEDFSGFIDEFQAYLSAMNQWNSLKYCKAKMVYGGKSSSGKDGNDDKNVLFFDNRGTISPGVYGLTTTTYNADTGEILDVDIGFNDTTFAWDTLGRNTSGASNKAYVESIATHELGHLLGLGHTFLNSAVMAPSAYVGEISQYFPERDDEIGVSALYPESGFSTDFAGIGGIATKNFTPVFGAGFALINLKDFTPTINTISEKIGLYALAGVDPGRYWMVTFPADESVLGDYYSTIDTSIAPQILGLNVGDASDPSISQKPTEFLLKAGVVNQENPTVLDRSLFTPFEPNDGFSDATALNLSAANGDPIVLAAELESATDIDMYKFNLQTGKKYSFIIISSSFITGFDSRITLYDAAYKELFSPREQSSVFLLEADDSDPNAYEVDGENLDPRVIGWTSTYTGEAFLKVHDWAGQSGYYFLIIREHDKISEPDVASSELKIDKTSLKINSAESARITVIVRNKFNEKITNLGPNDVEITIGTNSFLATQDTVDPSVYYYDLAAPAVGGSDEITAIIQPNVDPLFTKLTINYVDSVSMTKSVAEATPASAFADGYSEIEIVVTPKDSNNANVYDSTLLVTGIATDGVLGAFQFDIDTGLYMAVLTAPDSKTKINANVDVSINGSKIDSVGIVFEAKISRTKPSSSTSGGGCGNAGISRTSQNVSFLAFIVVILSLLVVRTRTRNI